MDKIQKKNNCLLILSSHLSLDILSGVMHSPLLLTFLTVQITLNEGQKSWKCFFTSLILDPNILLNVLFSNAVNQCSFLKLTDQVP
jgi:hypothetical protein